MGYPTADFGPITLSNISNTSSSLGFLASLTDPTLTATTAAIPREPAQLFPNPAHHAATLRLPAGTAPAPLTLTDALGRPVRRYLAPAGPETALDLRGLPAGLYLLRGAGPAQRLAVE
ncbi:T9SS type A sorting domain-containing protein [Hymenobacter sp. M29]|uniref:T9SS type A sorting domain-containing protein n=1 Tax=Hymenobacter mellowenesis TaxID=3063995 RepID=A0ABT9ABC8_9BACT|nr:T9SS type A sorting domain-containing protein [Hymenobacter sp. M29]MDO7847140.1 T9SS type A sorting domain-containing protein [Hymenobacter sp. M29]